MNRLLTMICLACALIACDDSSSSATDSAPLADAAASDGALPDGALPDGALPDGASDSAAPDAALPDAAPDAAPDAFVPVSEAVFPGPFALGDTLLDDEADERCFAALQVAVPDGIRGEVLALPITLEGEVLELEVTVDESCGAFEERGRNAETPTIRLRQRGIEVADFGRMAHGDAGDDLVATRKAAAKASGFPPGDYLLEFAIDEALEAVGPRDDLAFAGVTVRVIAGHGTVTGGLVAPRPEPRVYQQDGPFIIGDGAPDDDGEVRCFQALAVDPANHFIGARLAVDFELRGEAELLRFDVRRSCGVASFEGRSPQGPQIRLLRGAETIESLGELKSADNNEEVVQTRKVFSTRDTGKMLPAGTYTLEFTAQPAPALKRGAGDLEDAAFEGVEIRVVSGDATIHPLP